MRTDHAQRAIIRLNAAVDIENGLSVRSCAEKYGRTEGWVRIVAKESGVRANGRSAVISAKRKMQMREFSLLGSTQAAFQRLTGVNKGTVCIWARSMGLKFRKDNSSYADVMAAGKSKAAVMAALYQDGYTLAQIGEQYGITRERVRQLLKKHHRLAGGDGGKRVQAERSKAKRTASQDAKYMRSHGCTFEQYREVRDLGKKTTRERSPLGAFGRQRYNAGTRDIGWELTFWQWWTIWQQSGHWMQRGRGQGYVMCRNGDNGPYAVGNVYIATAAHNSSEGQNYKKLDPSLPIGVRRLNSGKFTAHRRINGRVIQLGSHATPELAHAAYLMASSPDFVPPAMRQGRAAPGTMGYQRRGKRYCAYVYRSGKYVHLGSFGTPEEARAAHLAAKAERLAA